jgi:hypothetical protein
VRVSRRNVGRIWKVSASASSRDASAEKVACPLVIRPRSWPSSREMAWKTRPVSRTTRRNATSCSSSGRSRSAPSSKKGAALPSESFRSEANWPVDAIPASCSHSWKYRRVVGSKARKTSSSSTVSCTFTRRSVPPSGRFSLSASPGDSST